MKVLVADDEPDVREVVATIMALHWADGEIIQAADGEAAVQCFYDHAPDLVILDVAMPRVSGLEALQRVRQVSDVPVILLTVRRAEIDIVSAAAGAHGGTGRAPTSIRVRRPGRRLWTAGGALGGPARQSDAHGV
jgi:DNA-binding response OmpR family regulator